MNRIDFIKGIIGVFGASVLPKSIYREYQKIYLLQSFVRGFRYYEGPGMLTQMKVGQLIELVREPDNPYDSCAIALYCNNHKIGYIPSEDNPVLSRLLDARLLDILAEITHLEPNAQTWENVCIAIYVLKESSSSMHQSQQYLTTLDTPEYHTLGWSDQKLGRICRKAEIERMTGSEFYDALVQFSETDEVYDLIHNSFPTGEDLTEVVEGMRLIIDKRNIPAALHEDRVLKAIDETEILLDHYFGKEGYVVANVDRVAELSASISRFKPKADHLGKIFYEVVFKK